MFEGYWPQFLEQHFNEAETKELTARATPASETQAADAGNPVYGELYPAQDGPIYQDPQGFDSQFAPLGERKDRKGSMFQRLRNWTPPRTQRQRNRNR